MKTSEGNNIDKTPLETPPADGDTDKTLPLEPTPGDGPTAPTSSSSALRATDSRSSLLAQSANFEDASDGATVAKAGSIFHVIAERFACRQNTVCDRCVRMFASCFYLCQAMSPDEASAAILSEKPRRGNTLDSALDIMSLQPGMKPIAAHADNAAQARGAKAVTLEDACRRAKRQNKELELPELDPEHQKKYKAFWSAYHVQARPKELHMNPDAVPQPSRPPPVQPPAEVPQPGGQQGGQGGLPPPAEVAQPEGQARGDLPQLPAGAAQPGGHQGGQSGLPQLPAEVAQPGGQAPGDLPQLPAGAAQPGGHQGGQSGLPQLPAEVAQPGGQAPGDLPQLPAGAAQPGGDQGGPSGLQQLPAEVAQVGGQARGDLPQLPAGAAQPGGDQGGPSGLQQLPAEVAQVGGQQGGDFHNFQPKLLNQEDKHQVIFHNYQPELLNPEDIKEDKVDFHNYQLK